MDFLNQAFGQLKELLQSMTPAARVTAVLLLGVIGVSLGYLIKHQSASPDVYLFNGDDLPAPDVNRAEAAIAQAGLTGFARVGNRIKVPSGQRSKYLAAVAEGDALPRSFPELLEKALDLGAFTDRITRVERLKAAREQQLSMILREMDFIEEAQVFYDVRQPQGLARVGVATASVNVRPRRGEPLDPRQAKMIKKTVASAIAGLSFQTVTVTDLSDGSTFGGGEISGDSFNDEYYQHRISYERLMKSNIEDLLRNIPGLCVQVSAELDDTIEKTTRTIQPEGDEAAVSTVENETINKTYEIAAGGRPGPIVNGPRGNTNDPAPNVTVKNENTISETQNDFIHGQRDEFVRSAPLVPIVVRVAVTVPENYLIDVWRERQRKEGKDPGDTFPVGAARTLVQSDVEKIVKDAVSPLLPKELAVDSQSMVSVQFLDSLTPKEFPGPSTAQQALGWASEHFNTMTMAVVALVSLMMLRSMIKSIPQPEPASALSGQTFSLDGADDAPESVSTEENNPTGDGRPRLRLKKGTSLKDDLTNIVQEDPDAAAAILRTWIGNAG